MPEAYPLSWPDGVPKTSRYDYEPGRFQITPGVALADLVEELRVMAAQYPVISSNVALRRDGLPYANQSTPEDAGVAVYWQNKGESYCVGCDRYDRPWKNQRAITLTLRALRGIERWGSSEMVNRAFAGYKALPAPGRPWHEVLGVREDAPPEVIEAAFKALTKKAHPDTGGDTQKMQQLIQARKTALQEAAA